jgi:hypothetical protein
MTKKFIISSFVLLLCLGSAMPALAGMTVSEVNLIGQFNSQWPDFNGFAWSVAGTSNGLPPKSKTSPDPNQLPSYATDYGPGTIRVFYTPVNGGANCQTFSTDGNTDGFALSRIAVRISGGVGAEITPDQNFPFTVHIFDVNANYGWVPPVYADAGSYTPINARPYGGGVDFLSGPAFAAEPSMMSVGSWDWDILLAFDFNEYDSVDLEPNHTYAFEVWGPLGWTAAPPYIWGMVWNSQEDSSRGTGLGYQPNGNGSTPGAGLDITNPRGMALGGPAIHSFVVGVYGDYADGNAYHPEPRKYQTQVSRNPVLTWHPGKWADVNTQDVNGGHQVWLSTNFAQVARRLAGANKGRVQDPCYTPTTDLALNTTYYWRVDEYNDQNYVNGVNVPHPDANYYWGVVSNISGDGTDRPTIWRFTTISPSASNPVPVSTYVPTAAAFKPQSAWLSWTPGALVADNNHLVYFGTSWGDVNHASEANGLPLYRGKVNDPCYPLKNLYPDYNLTSGTTFYWRVDEVNVGTAGSPWVGPVWNFKMPNPATITIDDFASSADFAKYWKTHYLLPGVSAPYNRVGGVISTVTNTLELIYNNSGKPSSDPNGPWSEAMLDYNNPSGIDWTIGRIFEPKAIGVQFDGTVGNTLNSNDANYDKLYLGIEDAHGRLGIVYYPDVYAAQRAMILSDSAATREFKVALTDLTNPNNVDLTEVNRVFVGIGSPRGSLAGLTGYKGGTGTLRYDNIKIYVQHCNPTYPQTSMVAGDLAGSLTGTPTGYHSRWSTPDCAVNLQDIYYLASDWLYAEPNLVYDSNVNPTTSNLTAWYKFDNADGNNAIWDYSGNSRHGTLYNPGPFTWWYAGHNGTGKCVNLEPGFKTWIECPNSIIAGTGATGQSFTFWLWHNVNLRQPHDWSSVLVFHSTAPGAGYAQTMETQLPAQPFSGSGTNSPWLRWVDMRVSSETGLQGAAGSRPSMIWGKWNHYALVYDTTGHQMRMYVNGKQISGAANDNFTTPWGPSATGDGNANTVRIATRGNSTDPASETGYDGGGFWQGRIDDMRLYSKALSVNEVQYLATDGTGKRDMQTIFIERDNFNNGTVTSSYLGGQPVQIINFKDFAGLASYWLNQQLWP